MSVKFAWRSDILVRKANQSLVHTVILSALILKPHLHDLDDFLSAIAW